MEELELREYWTIIRKRLLMVVLIPVIAALVSGVVSEFLLKPQYQASTTLLVNQKPTAANQGVQLSDITTAQALINTYSAIIKSETIAQAVVDKLHLSLTPGQLDGMISVSSPTQSQVIQVAVTAPDQAEAAHVANTLASVFQREALKIMDVENVQVVDPALISANPSPVKPNKKLNVAIAFILGLMVSVGLAFLLEYLDNRVRSEEDVRRYLNLPVLGSVLEYSEVD